MRCDIIIPIWNQPELTRQCIDSVTRNTEYPYRLILVDNGSADETAAYLRRVAGSSAAGAVLLRNDSNKGFIRAANQGMKASDAPYLCLLNNDTIVCRRWLSEMVAVAESSSDIGIVNPSSNTLGRRPADDESVEAYAGKLAASCGSGRLTELGSALGFCMLIKRNVINSVGYFDEAYGMGNFEDTDLSRRAAQAGFRLVIADRAYVYHKEGSSFSRVRTHDSDFMKNRKTYESRWGRPKRVLYVLSSNDQGLIARITAHARRLSLAGDWLYVYAKDSVDTRIIPLHSNLIIKKFPDRFFTLRTFIRVVTKKKRFDTIIR